MEEAGESLNNTDLLKVEDDFSLIQYDDEIIDQDGNKINDEYTNGGKKPTKDEGQLREILNSLLPPTKINNFGYKQVSSLVPTRDDVISLQKLWDEQLQIRQARETGICPIREQLNENAFNELIRQITINLPERGLLAIRIRDEAKMTIDTFQTLYQSSLAFGMRKCVESQQGINTLNEEIKQLNEKRNLLKKKVEQLQIEKQNKEKFYNETRQIDQKNQNEEKEFLKHQKQALQSYLKTEFGK